MGVCPHHPRTTLRTLPQESATGLAYCPTCERAYRVKDGVADGGIAIVVDPGIDLCPRCRDFPRKCTVCNRPACPGHTKLFTGDWMLCNDCGKLTGVIDPLEAAGQFKRVGG
jgi:hypothetical protein